MNNKMRERYLRWALAVFGFVFVFVAYPLTRVWPSGWLWMDPMRHNISMMLAVYFVVGVFMLLAAINPKRHLSFIGFVIWSSLLHGFVMLVMALGEVSAHWPHLLGDAPALILIGFVLGWLCPQALKFDFIPRADDAERYPEPTTYTQGASKP